MNFSLDQPVIRTFSSYLRFFQLALQVLVGILISRMGNNGCSTMMTTVGEGIVFVLLILNLLGMGIIKCVHKLVSSRVFWISYAINVVLAGVLFIVGLLGIGQLNSCASNRVLHRFAGFQGLIAIIVSVITLFIHYDFALRYTNGPGNLTWVFLFFSFPWNGTFSKYYIFAGLLNLVITISMLSVHIVFMVTKFNPNIKRIIYYVWVGSFLAMVIAQVVVFIAYVAGSNTSFSTDMVAVKIAQTFIPVNIIDAIFWLFGFVSLRIKNQDQIYQQALSIKERQQRGMIF